MQITRHNKGNSQTINQKVEAEYGAVIERVLRQRGLFDSACNDSVEEPSVQNGSRDASLLQDWVPRITDVRAIGFGIGSI